MYAEAWDAATLRYSEEEIEYLMFDGDLRETFRVPYVVEDEQGDLCRIVVTVDGEPVRVELRFVSSTRYEQRMLDERGEPVGPAKIYVQQSVR